MQKPKRILKKLGLIGVRLSKTDKQRVLKLFTKGKVLYFSDISAALDMDLKKVVEICRVLVAERKIRVRKGI